MQLTPSLQNHAHAAYISWETTMLLNLWCFVLYRLTDGGLLISLDGSSHTTYMKEEVSGYRVIIGNKTCVFEKENDPSVLRWVNVRHLIGICELQMFCFVNDRVEERFHYWACVNSMKCLTKLKKMLILGALKMNWGWCVCTAWRSKIWRSCRTTQQDSHHSTRWLGLICSLLSFPVLTLSLY